MCTIIPIFKWLLIYDFSVQPQVWLNSYKPFCHATWSELVIFEHNTTLKGTLFLLKPWKMCAHLFLMISSPSLPFTLIQWGFFGASMKTILEKLHLKALLCVFVSAFSHRACCLLITFSIIQPILTYSRKIVPAIKTFNSLSTGRQFWGYWPDPCEVMGRWVGFGTTGELHILLTHMPIFVNSNYRYHWGNCKTK